MQAKWQVFVRAFVEYGGAETVLIGLKNTLLIAVLGLVIGILIGTVIAVVKVMPRENKLARVIGFFGDVYVTVFRGTPIVVQLLIFYYILFPALGVRIDSLVVAIVTFGMNSGAYVAEIMRGGIQSVDKGLFEAGRALGLSRSTTMLRIVIPQAMKNILPTLGNEFIALVKDTSVVGFIATLDLTQAFKRIGSQNYEFIIPYLLLAAIYLVIVLIITGGVKLLERRLAKSDRRS
jgi:polar amino acid transport system permease protein